MIENQTEETKSKISEVNLPLGLAITSMSKDILVEIGLPLLKQIALVTSQATIYPVLSKVQSIEDLLKENFLATDAYLSELTFWKIVTLVHAATKNNLVGSLVAQGILFERGEDNSAYLARAFKEHSQVVAEVMTTTADKQTKNNLEVAKTYHLFQSGKDATFTFNSFKAIDPAVFAERLAVELDKHGYSDYCDISITNFKGNPGFVVTRGARNQKRLTIPTTQKVKKAKVHDGHDVKTDLVLFDPSNNTLWVNSAKGDHQIYAETVGDVIGDKSLFFVKRSFDLSVLLEKNFVALLNQAAGGDSPILKVELRHVTVKNEHGVTSKIPAGGRYAPCLTTRSSAIPEFLSATEVLSVKLRLVLSHDGKDSATIELTNSSLNMGSLIQLEDLMACLTKITVWKAYGH